MFTGIVSDLGSVRAVEPSEAGARLEIEAPRIAESLSVGDSVAVNGVCLTAVAVVESAFAVDVVHETLTRTALGELTRGDPVDLERPMPGNGRFDGHIVQGHVDGVGRVLAVVPEGDSRRMRIGIPSDLARYTVEKGSIAVDGVSLTITAVSAIEDAPWFEVALIPHTLDVTVLGSRTTGDPVNLEVDVLAKYVERLMEAAS